MPEPEVATPDPERQKVLDLIGRLLSNPNPSLRVDSTPIVTDRLERTGKLAF